MAINSAMKGALGEDPSVFSRQCAQALLLVKCRLCDPDYGQDKKPTVCLSLCSSWLAACRNDYFGFTFSGDLVPCTTLSSSKILVCSRLEELLIEHRKDQEGEVAPETALCQLVGLQVEEEGAVSDACYSGSISSISPSSCEDAKLIVQPTRSDKSLEGSKSILGPATIAAGCVLLVMAYRRGLLSFLLGQGRQARYKAQSGGLTEEERRTIARAVEQRQQELKP